MAVAQARSRNVMVFAKWVAAASLLLSLLQLMLGTDPSILALCLATEAVCLWPVLLYGFERTTGVFFLLIWLNFSFSGLVFKTILLQSLDSNLFNPPLTFAIQLAGALSFSLAATIAYLFKGIHKNAIAIVTNPDTLSVVGVIFFLTGTLGFWLTHSSNNEFLVSSRGGGLSLAQTLGTLIEPMIGYGIVCEVASTIIRSGRKSTFSWASVTMIGILLAFSLMANGKGGMLLPGLIYSSCVFAFRARVKWQTALLAVVTLIFFSEFLFPAIHIARHERTRIGPLELASQTTGIVVGLMIGDPYALGEKEALNFEAETQTDFYRNLYFGSQQVWLDRFTNTGFIDAVARRLSFDGPFLGVGPVVGNTFTSVLPRQLSPTKFSGVQVGAGDSILQAYGLEPINLVSFATVPLPVELFAAGGFMAILLVGTGLTLMFLLVLNFLVYDFKENPWAVCFFIFYGMNFAGQTHDAYSFMALRQMPFDFLFMTFAVLLATAIKRGFSAAGGSRAAKTAAA